jgi:hypothetical protein
MVEPRSACPAYNLQTRPMNMAISIRRLSLVLLAFAVGAVAQAADSPRQVWLLSTRNASHSGTPSDAADAIRYWRLNDDCDWSPADAKTFQNDATAVPTVVFLHGNGTDANEAVAKGMYAYQSICSEVGDKPFRYVIWSWPADRMCRHFRSDAQLKAVYGDADSYYLACWLASLRPELKVSLVGHSFGPRVIAGALHMLAGGEIAGQKLPDSIVSDWTTKKRNPIRAVLLSAATDADSLAPNGRQGLALSLIDQVLITRNGCDTALRWYPKLYGRSGPNAIGFVGPCGVGDAEKLTVVDVSCTAGKTHDYRCYCSASNVRSQWARYTFLDGAP